MLTNSETGQGRLIYRRVEHHSCLKHAERHLPGHPEGRTQPPSTLLSELHIVTPGWCLGSRMCRVCTGVYRRGYTLPGVYWEAYIGRDTPTRVPRGGHIGRFIPCYMLLGGSREPLFTVIDRPERLSGAYFDVIDSPGRLSGASFHGFLTVLGGSRKPLFTGFDSSERFSGASFNGVDSPERLSGAS